MTQPSDASQLVAQLLAEALRKAQGEPGVLVRDVPHLDPDAVIPSLSTLLAEGIDLCIAYLDATAADRARAPGVTEDIFTTSIEQAEIWRNTRNLDALIVVITKSDTRQVDFVGRLLSGRSLEAPGSSY